MRARDFSRRVTYKLYQPDAKALRGEVDVVETSEEAKRRPITLARARAAVDTRNIILSEKELKTSNLINCVATAMQWEASRRS